MNVNDLDFLNILPEALNVVKSNTNKMPEIKGKISELLNNGVDSLIKRDSKGINDLLSGAKSIKEEGFKKHKDSIEDLKKWQ